MNLDDIIPRLTINTEIEEKVDESKAIEATTRKDNKPSTALETEITKLNEHILSPDLDSPAAVALAQAKKVKKKKKILRKPKILKKRKNTSGNMIDESHHLYQLTYGMMYGIRESVSIANQINTKLQERDFMAIDNNVYPPEGSLAGGPNGSPSPNHILPNPFKFKDYAPQVFRRIRSRFGIDPVDYMVAVCGDFNYIEFISNSKSNQFFFYSSDSKYMIKTQTKGESKFLRRILPRYYLYIMQNPNTLICRFYGMHRVKMYNIKKSMHFVIMQSVFYTEKEIHSVYDLKGSHVGRKASEKEKNSKNPVLKDIDFEEIGEKLHLGKNRKAMFTKQIKDDTQFLSQLNIMDYSLLIGVHRHTLANKKIGRRMSSVTLATSAEELRSRSSTTSATDATTSAKDATTSTTYAITSATDATTSTTDTSISRSLSVSKTKSGLDIFSHDGIRRIITSKVFDFTEEGDEFDYSTDEETVWKREAERIKRSNSNLSSLSLSSLSSRSYSVHVPIFTTEDGGIHGVTSDDAESWNGDIYFFGVIDILQQYNTKKGIENIFKSFKFDRHEISSVSSKEYAARFCKFLDENSC